MTVASPPTIDQLYQYGLPQTAVAGVVDDSVLTQELAAAWEIAMDYLRGRGQLPLLEPVPLSLVQKVCHIAAYNIMRNRGFSPTADADSTIKDAYYEAVGYPDRPGSGWLPAVQKQAIHPVLVFSASPTPENGYRFPTVIIQPNRRIYPCR